MNTLEQIHHIGPAFTLLVGDRTEAESDPIRAHELLVGIELELSIVLVNDDARRRNGLLRDGLL